MAKVRVMPRRLISLILASLVASALLPSAAASAQDANRAAPGHIRAGYGQADATWHVGAGAGQYSEKSPQDAALGAAGEEMDPHNHSLVQKDSYGVQSRLSYRAIVVEDSENDQVAFVKSDNYLAQDALARRAAQILLLEGSEISYEEIFHMASHNHYSPYYTSPSWGVWLFQDVFDIRAFEYEARQMAAAIREAELNLVDAKMGATTVEHHLYKGMVARRGVADDGTPVGYPLDFGDFGLSVIRFDSLDNKPIATLVNWGMHPEGLKSDNLITAEFLAPLERFVERATGGGIVFGQGDVGSSESGPARPYEFPEGIMRQWDDAGHAQVERGAFLLARDVIKAYNMIGRGEASPAPYDKSFVPFTSDFDVEAGNAFVPGPYSHPYPSVSNCRSEKTVKGDNGVPITGLPDCDREGPAKDFGAEYPDTPPEVATPAGMIWDNMQAHGIPVPAHYDAPGYTGVEENMRIKLQAFKLGEVILLSCACEAQVDLILNLETRVDKEQGNLYLGYDWTKRLDCTQAGGPEGDWTCVRKEDDPAAPTATFANPLHFTNAAYERMHNQIYKDARGWDSPENAAQAGTDPDDVSKIWGNFTHEELSPELGYKLAIGVGHAGDYNGYTVSYREYMAYDHYRKALTSYGPHTADYMNTRLTELAAELNGAPDELDPVEEADEARAAADEARQVAATTALGAASFAAYEAWTKSLPNDSGNVGTVKEQPKNIKRFDAATFSWVGGSNAVDNPTVTVQRKVDGAWKDFANQSGEIQTKVDFPNGLNGFFDAYSGAHEWVWTANFEAFDAFPAEIGSTPAGTYRFVVEGQSRQGFANVSYPVESEEFTVSPWDGLEIKGLRAEPDGSVSFEVNSKYPETYTSVFPYVKHHLRGEADRGELRAADIGQWCDTCSFRPWATAGTVASAELTVVRADGDTETVSATLSNGRWVADADLYAGDTAFVDQGDTVDNYGESNRQRSSVVEGVRERENTKVETGLSLIIGGDRARHVRGARLYEALSPEVGIAGQKIEFFYNGVLVGSSVTGADGVASFKPAKNKDPEAYEARFAGNDGYLASSSRAL
jgi:hypothetical protein